MSSQVSTNGLHGVRPNAFHAFGGVWNLTWRRFVGAGQGLFLLGIVAALSLLTYARIRHGQEAAFLPWFSDFYLQFALPLLAFLSGAAAIRDGLKSSTTDFVLTRPIRRSFLVGFQFLSQQACAQVFYFIVLCLLLIFASVFHVPEIGRMAPRLVLVQSLAIASFGALGFLFGVISSRYVVLGIVYAVTVEVALGRIPTQLNRLSILHQLTTLLEPLRTLSPNVEAAGSISQAGTVVLLLCYTAFFVALCAVLFSQREFIGAAGRES